VDWERNRKIVRKEKRIKMNLRNVKERSDGIKIKERSSGR